LDPESSVVNISISRIALTSDLKKIVEPIDNEIKTVTLPKIKQVFSTIVFFVLFHHNIAQPTKNKKLCQMFNKKPNRL